MTMKILMTTDAVGGVWHYAIDLAQHLMSEQIEVVLVCMGPEPRKSKLEMVEATKRWTSLLSSALSVGVDG